MRSVFLSRTKIIDATIDAFVGLEKQTFRIDMYVLEHGLHKIKGIQAGLHEFHSSWGPRPSYEALEQFCEARAISCKHRVNQFREDSLLYIGPGTIRII